MNREPTAQERKEALDTITNPSIERVIMQRNDAQADQRLTRDANVMVSERLEQAEQQRDDWRAMAERLREAGWHGPNCSSWEYDKGMQLKECDCGWDKAIIAHDSLVKALRDKDLLKEKT